MPLSAENELLSTFVTIYQISACKKVLYNSIIESCYLNNTWSLLKSAIQSCSKWIHYRIQHCLGVYSIIFVYDHELHILFARRSTSMTFDRFLVRLGVSLAAVSAAPSMCDDALSAHSGTSCATCWAPDVICPPSLSAAGSTSVASCTWTIASEQI